jgi:hypothetical protein
MERFILLGGDERRVLLRTGAGRLQDGHLDARGVVPRRQQPLDFLAVLGLQQADPDQLLGAVPARQPVQGVLGGGVALDAQVGRHAV